MSWKSSSSTTPGGGFLSRSAVHTSACTRWTICGGSALGCGPPPNEIYPIFTDPNSSCKRAQYMPCRMSRPKIDQFGRYQPGRPQRPPRAARLSRHMWLPEHSPDHGKLTPALIQSYPDKLTVRRTNPWRAPSFFLWPDVLERGSVDFKPSWESVKDAGSTHCKSSQRKADQTMMRTMKHANLRPSAVVVLTSVTSKGNQYGNCKHGRLPHRLTCSLQLGAPRFDSRSEQRVL